MFNYIRSNKFLLILIFISFIIHILSSFNSIGFYSDDEHFQVLEISAYLLGINNIAINDPTGYYWEWQEAVRMRPWIQPHLYFYIINFLRVFVGDNPFIWALCLRLLSSLIGFGSMLFLFLILKDKFFNNNKIFNYLLFFTFWFFPFLHSRTSAESLSLSLFIISFCLLYLTIISKNYKFNFTFFIFGSFIMGLSMIFKFTTVFVAFPFFIWFLIFRFNFLKLFIFGFLVIVALSFGLYIDYINWGSYENTYLKFYIHNLSSRDGYEMNRMQSFGVDPWYYYFLEILKQLAPVLSLFFLAGLIYFWIKKPTNVLTWITLSTFIIYSLIPHKEIRYVFSIYIFAPFFIAYLFENFPIKYLSNISKYLIIISNIVFLIITTLTPANGKVAVYKYIFENIQKDEEIYYTSENPYLVNNMEAKFYTYFIPKISKLDTVSKNISNIWVATNSYSDVELLLHQGCEVKHTTYPKKIIDINKNWRRLKLNWYILFCK